MVYVPANGWTRGRLRKMLTVKKSAGLALVKHQETKTRIIPAEHKPGWSCAYSPAGI